VLSLFRWLALSNLKPSNFQVVSFDGSTTIEEFLCTLSHEIGCRDSSLSGFTLFSDDPIEKDLEHFVELNAKVTNAKNSIESSFLPDNLVLISLMPLSAVRCDFEMGNSSERKGIG
jgi:hypothetical protein